MIFSVSASSDRKTYTVVNNTTKKTATLVYDFDNYTATVSGDFCLVPIGVYGFPLPTDLPLPEFGEISVALSASMGYVITRAGDQSESNIVNREYDNTTKTGRLNYAGCFSVYTIQVYVKDGSPLKIPCTGSIESYLTATPANYTDSTEGTEFSYTFSSDGLSAQCEFPGVNPCLVNSMGVKLVSDHGDAPAYVDVSCTESRAYTFSDTLFPTLSQSGWRFGGWCVDSACQTQAVAGQAYTVPTLYAKWTELDAVCVVERQKGADGQYHPVHRQTEARLVKTADGGNLQDALDNKADANYIHDKYAPKANPVFTESISLGRKEGSTIGANSVAVGYQVTAEGEYSCARGHKTWADNFASCAIGHTNKATTGGGAWNNTVGDAFVIGNGQEPDASVGGSLRFSSNCFRVTYAGEVYGLAAFNSTGADYAEYFEWQDSNPEQQDRVGYFVTLDGTEIRVAQPGDYILGIVSGQPCIIGNADEDWLSRWEHDEFGRFVKEDVDTPVTEWQEVETTTDDGTHTERVEVPTGEVIHGWRYKANPDYNPAQAYTERKDRPEWSAVGMLGVLSVRDDGTCQVNGFCQVAEGGIATAAAGEFSLVDGQIRKGYRVMERVSDSIIKVIFR